MSRPIDLLQVCLSFCSFFYLLCDRGSKSIAIHHCSRREFSFGETITYDSFFSLISFSLLVSVIVVFWSPVLLFIGKGLAYLLKLPVWLTYTLEWVSSWIVLHLSIKYVLYLNLMNVSIGDSGVLILSFFVSFLIIEIDLVYSRKKQRKQSLDTYH